MASHLIILGLASSLILEMLTSIVNNETDRSAVSVSEKLTVFTLVQVALFGYLSALVLPALSKQLMILSAVFVSVALSSYLVFYLPRFATSNVKVPIRFR